MDLEMEKFKAFLIKDIKRVKALRESGRDGQIDQITGALRNLSDSDFEEICNQFGIPSNDQKLNGTYQIRHSDIKLNEPIFNDENIPSEFAEIDATSKDIYHDIMAHLQNCMNPNFAEYIKITKVKKDKEGYSVSLIYTKDGTTAEYIFA
jgi:hypothetical protein